MEKITTFIINLEEAKDRKEYMKNILVTMSDMFAYSFVSAVDGRRMTEQEIGGRFDTALAYKRYGRPLSGGEVGCTLSHYQCYEKIAKLPQNYALVLEDDITILGDMKEIENLIPYIDREEPAIIFLSGDYWYYRTRKISEHLQLASVYDAVGSYAYLINSAAAKRILEKNELPACVADNWSLYRRQGIRLYAVYPYMVDANIESFSSSINQAYFGEIRHNMPWKYRIDSYRLSLVKRILLQAGKFVSKIRK